MVCKEDVLLWFKDLESYKRIDVMYELLNMCVPFEVRYLGSCIEEYGKHTYQELRGPTIMANDIERLTKDPTLHLGLLDKNTRHRAVIYMSVLSARNCSCANWFYRTLFRTEHVENFVNGLGKDSDTLSELLLLFTLGVYHPAFTFEQKCYFGRLLEKLISQHEGSKTVLSETSFLPGPLHAPRNFCNLLETTAAPAKQALILPGGDALHIQPPPPGLPILPHAIAQPTEMFPQKIMSRAMFQQISVGVPEVHPFPPQPVSPAVSQAASPPHSRATSPQRPYNVRPLPAASLLQPIQNEHIPSAPPLHTEPQISQTSNLLYNAATEVLTVNTAEENNHLLDNINGEFCLSNRYEPIKLQNGIRCHQNYAFLDDQLKDLKISGDSSLHCSSSSNSSLNQSPTETPSVTPSVTPHGPGRGGTDLKARVNGMPSTYACDNASQQVPFSNCTVPSYTMPPVPPSRYYNQTYRAHTLATPYSFPQNEVYTFPYLIYSSLIPPPPRNPNCYNCGGMGHIGNDCNGHSVEDIIQKPYILEYDSSTLPDNPPEK